MKSIFSVLLFGLLFSISSVFALGKRDGPFQVYEIGKIKNVLQGNGKTCENGLKNGIHHYECNETGDYKTINNFIYYLESGRYQRAADLMNRKNMMPRIISSINDSVYFLPYKKGLIGIFISGNGESYYDIRYITVYNGKLYNYNSKSGFYPGYNSDLQSFLSRHRLNSGKLIDKYDIKINKSCFSSDPYSDKYNKCIKSYLNGVLSGNIKDKNTSSWIDAMKKKIDKLYIK